MTIKFLYLMFMNAFVFVYWFHGHENGEQCVKAITDEKDADYLWQAKSSVVPFVRLTSELSYFLCFQEACIILIGGEERFSIESVVNALKYFDQEKKRYLQELKKV